MTPTPQRHLFIAPDFALPLDILVEKSAILGRSGSGKTNTSTVLVEELLSAKQQVIIIDPPGAWWGLRSSADGSQDGYPIVILGGEHSDLPLDDHQGTAVANLLIDTRLSAVLDLSDFSMASIARFGRDFAKQLYERKARHREPLLLVVEEADELIPQQPQPNQTECLAAFERIAKRGRMRGIGGLRITQRSASLNKNDLSQVAILIAMQTTDPRDRDAIDNWIKLNCSKEQREQLLGELASLPQGSGFLIWPQASMFERLNFRRRRTFDSSATPKPGETLKEPATLATINLEELRTALGAKPDKNPQPTSQDQLEHIQALELPLKEHITDNDHLIKTNNQLRSHIETLEYANALAHTTITNAIEDHLKPTLRRLELRPTHQRELTTNSHRPDSQTTLPQRRKGNPSPRPTNQRKRLPDPAHEAFQKRADATLEYKLKAGERKILETITRFHTAGLNRTQVATLAGFSPTSGTYSTYLSNLTKLDLCSREGDQLTVTAKTHTIVSPATSPITHDVILHRWLHTLKLGERNILQALVKLHPKDLTKSQLAHLVNMAPTSGTFSTYLSHLKKNGLIITDKTHIKASPYLWP